jgi:hypothetical protein
MGVNSKNSKSDDYQLKETRQDELGKTFVYDRVEDNIDRVSQSNERHTRANNETVLLRTTLLGRIVIIIIASVPLLISVIADFLQKSPPNVISPAPASSPSAIETPPIELTKDGKRNIGILKESLIFSDWLTSKDREKTYFFTLDKPSNVSLYLDNVTNELGMRLYVDTNGNKIIDSGEQIDSASAYSNSTGAISKTLGVDSYIVTVQFKGGNSDYTLQLVNNTNDAINVGSLQERKTFSDTVFLNRTNRKKYYLFSLMSPSNVNILLDRVTNEVGMWLYVDTNGNGVIDSGEQINSVSAYSNSAGTIKRSLGADNYILVVMEKGANTNYTVTLTSQ